VCGADADTVTADDQDIVNADCEGVELPAATPDPGPGPGTGQPVVPTPDTTAPAVTLGARRVRLRPLSTKGLRITLSCSEACNYALALQLDRRTARKLKLPRVIGRRSGARITPGSFAVTVKLTRVAARKVARLRTLKLSVVLSASDAAGNRAGMRRSLSLRR
jgi:hypothetical protein